MVAVQYPGRQERRTEPLVDSIEELADLIVPELEPWLDRPLTFFGHSMGASPAYEVALRLEARGTTLLGLFASHTAKDTTFRFFDGGHFYLNSHAPEVLREIRQFVAERAAVASCRTQASPPIALAGS